MSAREWKPGTVAMVTGPRRMLFPTSEENMTIPCRREHDVWYAIGLKDRGFTDREVVDVAPLDLVVVDPEDREQVERLADLLTAAEDTRANTASSNRVDSMQAALRSLIAPPKPEEPLGLGAVVEDADGDQWVRVAGNVISPWCHGGRFPKRWHDIAAVRILSGGVA